MKKKIAVAGGGGFIGGELVKVLLSQGHDVVVADIKPFDKWEQLHEEAENLTENLEGKDACYRFCEGADFVYNLACNMGGMGFIENNKALCMISVLINTHLLMAARDHGVSKFFYASSACVYPDYLQDKTNDVALKEHSVYPAMPEDGYGWEKLFSERMCQKFNEDFGLDVRIARFHNVYGPNGSWDGGREKAPAAISRKVVEAIETGSNTVEVWGDGEQTRSFMYIDDCIEGTLRLMDSDVLEPINIGSSELVSINSLVDVVAGFTGKEIRKQHDLGAPLGVRGRNSDNTMIMEKLGWQPSIPLEEGMRETYNWIRLEWLKREKTK